MDVVDKMDVVEAQNAQEEEEDDEKVENLYDEEFQMKVAVGAAIGLVVVCSLGYYFFSRRTSR